MGTTSAHDETALFTIALLPDGRRRVMALEAGRWTAPEILDRIRATHARYRSTVRIETNAAQDYLRQFLVGEPIPIEAHTTTARNRNDPAYGVESLAVELEQGLWIVPDAPATRAWARELLTFSPRGHAGDRLIASWLAGEAARAANDQRGMPLGIVRGESTFDPTDGTESEDGFDDGSWVLDSNPPSLPLQPYRRGGARYIGGAGRNAPALQRGRPQTVPVSSGRAQAVGGQGGGFMRPFWSWIR